MRALELDDGFADVFGSERGRPAGCLFAAELTGPGAERLQELSALVKAGDLRPALAELSLKPALIASRPLAAELAELVTAAVRARTEDLYASRVRTITHTCGVRDQHAEQVVYGGQWPKRLHIWPSAEEYGVPALQDLPSGEILSACGEQVWFCERVVRGRWHAEPERRCEQCAKLAGEYPDCQEERMYPVFEPAGLSQLRAAVAARLRAGLRHPSSDPEQFSQALHDGARGAYLKAAKDICAQRILASRPRHERILGAEEYMQLSFELTRAGIATPVERVLDHDAIRALLSEREIESGFEFARALTERILHASGLAGRYMDMELPRPSWRRW